MLETMRASMSLLNGSGIAILVAIATLLVTAVAVSALAHARYARIARDLRRTLDDGSSSFDTPLLNAIVREAVQARRNTRDVNSQAIIEAHFAAELSGWLAGERFVKATGGLVIILGLVGTFYGLTMSIGRLVTLVSSDVTANEDVARSLTAGLTDALSGMSVAFTTSLFGILAAIALTLLSVFWGVGERRRALMVQLESFLDNVLLGHAARDGAGDLADGGLGRALHEFGATVGRLDGAVARIDEALAQFAGSTRDFREFNHQLRDNIQRMSVSFADLSEALQQRAGRRPDEHR